MLTAHLVYSRKTRKFCENWEMTLLFVVCIVQVGTFPVNLWAGHGSSHDRIAEETKEVPHAVLVAWTISWWLYRLTVQIMYYRRFLKLNVETLASPCLKVWLTLLLAVPVALMVWNMLPCQNKGAWIEHIAMCQREAWLYVTIPLLTFVALCYDFGFALLLYRFMKQAKLLKQTETAHHTKLLLRRGVCWSFAVTITATTQIFVYVLLQAKYHALPLVFFTCADQVLACLSCVFVRPGWRDRILPWRLAALRIEDCELKKPFVSARPQSPQPNAQLLDAKRDISSIFSEISEIFEYHSFLPRSISCTKSTPASSYSPPTDLRTQSAPPSLIDNYRFFSER